jgi:hypothetical protein
MVVGDSMGNQVNTTLRPPSELLYVILCLTAEMQIYSFPPNHERINV